MIPQLFIVVFGVSAVHLAASKTTRGRLWAGVLGVCAQPFWLWTTIANEQYLISCLCLLYGWGWIRTIRNNARASNTPG